MTTGEKDKLAGKDKGVQKRARTIWRELSKIGEAIPAEEWDRLPRDGARNFDHYMGRAPKEDSGGELVPLTIVAEEIDAYAASQTTAVSPLLEELGAATEKRFGAMSRMLSGQVPGMLLQMLVFASGAKRVLEIGMFTGYSAQMMAAALPDDGRVTTCDVDTKAIAMAKEFFARGRAGHKIDVREGPALETMKSLEPGFDLIFIDADKGNYINYYEAALPLLAPRGVIVVDNVLWSGRVLQPESPDDHAIVAFNEHVRDDARVAQVMLTVRDGMTLIRRA